MLIGRLRVLPLACAGAKPGLVAEGERLILSCCVGGEAMDDGNRDNR